MGSSEKEVQNVQRRRVVRRLSWGAAGIAVAVGVAPWLVGSRMLGLAAGAVSALALVAFLGFVYSAEDLPRDD